MEENYNPAKGSGEQEMTLRDIILLFREYALEIWRKKWWIALCCLPFIGWKAYEYSKSKVTYTAKVTFMIDDGKGGGLGLGGILSTLSGAEAEDNYDKIVALSKSMRIIGEVLMTKVTVNGKNDFIGNHLIDVEKVNDEIWAKQEVKEGRPSLNGFRFTRAEIDSFTTLEYSAVKHLMGLLNGSEHFAPIFTAGYDKKSGIMTFKVSCQTEEMSIVLLNNFYDVLSRFYIEKTVEKNSATYQIVKAKTDSIRRALNSIESRKAAFDDASHAVLLNVDKVPSQRYDREKQLLTLMYGESVKNLELANFALKSNTPYIQLIDKAVPPLLRNPVSRFKLLLTAIGMGVAFSISFIVLRKIFYDSLYA